MGDNELTSLPLWPHGLRGTLESEQEQRNSGWSRSAHTPIKRISKHRDTISCHPLCCTNDLIDMKGRCCPKIVVSIPRSFLHPGNYDTSEASYRKQRIRYDGKLVKKREVDILSCYKWWINEDIHRWSFDKPLKIVYYWYLKYLLTQTFFMVIAQWRFHSTWSAISFPKIRRKKHINWNLFPHFDTI